MCPICQNEEFSIVGMPYKDTKTLKIIRKDYRVVKCNNCSLYFVDPQIDFTNDEWKYIYDGNYFIEKSNWYTNKRKVDSSDRLEKMANFAKNKIENFLDIGCGEGYTLIEAENRNWNVIGIDITDNRIEAAKKNSISFINTNLLNSNFSDNYFDAIYLDSVLEHVVNPLDYLNEIFRILKKGGILYLGVPNEDSLLNDIRKLTYKVTQKNITEKIKPFQSPYHINGFNESSFKFSLKRVGFDIMLLRNFACRVEFMKMKLFTKEYLLTLLLLPIYLLAVPLKREVYLEAYVQK